MKSYKTIIVTGLLLLALTNIKAAKPDKATVLLAKLDSVVFGVADKTADIQMILLNLKSGKKKIKEAVLFQKGMGKKIFRYTAPKSEKGIATLSLPNNQVYLYLPLFKTPKKITNLATHNSFNKSDFSFEDMATTTYTEKYQPEFIRSTDSSYVLRLKPKIDDSKYDVIILSMDKVHYFPQSIEYYNNEGDVVKKAQYHYKKIMDYWVADQVSMKNMKANHMTTIIMTNIVINQGLDDDLFTVEALTR